jgi:SAM-dependent methyltransferase
MVFDTYARYYDLLYEGKDYASEAAYVAGLIEKHAPGGLRILELGCGTGAHAEHLARMGYVVHGVDLSETMLARAKARRSSLPAEIAARTTFQHGDVRTVRTGQVYDAVVSLFHVMSYQTTDADQVAMFDTAAGHLTAGGLFLFDFWHGPAVLAQRPELRVKRLEDKEIKVTRLAEPVMHEDRNVVDVNYTVFIEQKSTGRIEEVCETHNMRYLFPAEIARLAGAGCWTRSDTFCWMEDGDLGPQHWSACAVALRK